MRKRYQSLIFCAAIAATGVAVAQPALAAPVGATDPTVGAITVGSARYAIGSNAVFVSNSGNDTNPGTAAAPVSSVARAIRLATSGATIVLRGGVYHEAVVVPESKSLTFENYPGEAAWLDGSSVVAGWTKQGSTWVHPGWNYHFDSTAGYNQAAADGYTWLDPAYPMAAHPDQVWVNGVWLQQVASTSQVVTGTFFYDESAKKLIIGSDPTGVTVRASTLGKAFQVGAPHTTIRGIGIRRYATSLPDLGTIRVYTDYFTLENVLVSENSSQGVNVSGKYAKVNRVTAQYMGLTGIQMNGAYNSVVSNVLVQRNNRDHFSPKSPVQGGIKITKTRTITLKNSIVRDNQGENGVWFDQSCYDVTVIHNRITGNGRVGLYTELSSVIRVVDNYLVDNGLDQYRIFDTNQVRFWNNTLGGGAPSRAIGITQDTRRASNTDLTGHDPQRPLPDPTVTWVVGDIVIADNIVGTGALHNVYVMDQSGQRSASQMNITVDGNLFSAQPVHYADLVMGNADGTTYTKYQTADAMNAANPANGESNADSPTAMTTAALAASQQARAGANAIPLPIDLAQLVGQPNHVEHLGSF